ncbi:MAG: 16S rRNA (guanine(966)-N(2))-methyltransferase RsmD [Desulfovibrionaceae bacterium]|nr:16S rRNA (guanine(966)-N(2))-methyltransferase RsmD [Desulfovibrionaceae bacterium]
MRIIGGSLRSRVLKSPKGLDCRPAMGRTREAIFSMLEARGVVWQNTRVLDVFAGSGSLSFEALSRGAVCAWLLEKNPHALQCIKANAENLDLLGQVNIVPGDALKIVRQGTPTPFEVIFIDPPYRQNLVNLILNSLLHGGWVANNAIVLCEVEVGYKLIPPKDLVCLTTRVFGQTEVIFCQLQVSDNVAEPRES